MPGWGTFFPGARVDGVILPFLAPTYEEHDEAEDKHDGPPGEVDVHAHGFLVDGAVVGDEAVEGHQASSDEEDEAEGDTDVESHSCEFSVASCDFLVVSCQFQLLVVAYLPTEN